MGLLNTLSEWYETRQERKLEAMKAKGVCPECHGRGFNLPVSEFYVSPDYYSCPGCKGTGSYNDWISR